MTLMILERVSPSLRGELSKWLIEAATGVFVGTVSKLVREQLWQKCMDRADGGTLTCIWRARNEQGFDLLNHNPKDRRLVDMEGIWIAEVLHKSFAELLEQPVSVPQSITMPPTLRIGNETVNPKTNEPPDLPF